MNSTCYRSRITRLHPAAFILLLDRSNSMREKIVFGGRETTKSEALALTANMFVSEMINRCRREDGVRDYFRLAAIGYGDDATVSLLGGTDGFATPSALDRMDVPVREISRERILPDGRGILSTTMQKYWITPQAAGSTPMYAALAEAETLLQQWCRKSANRESYPPVVIHITDGEATDADPVRIAGIAERIRSTATLDGNTLLFNIHIGTARTPSGEGILFPSSPEELPPSKYARLLYDISSVLPAPYEAPIRQLKETSGTPPFRGMCYNCPFEEILATMRIGSMSVRQMQ